MKIEKNVPVPTGRGLADLCRRMEIGDSVFVNGDGPKRFSVHTIAKTAGIKVVSRTEGDGYRFWRVA